MDAPLSASRHRHHSTSKNNGNRQEPPRFRDENRRSSLQAELKKNDGKVGPPEVSEDDTSANGSKGNVRHIKQGNEDDNNKKDDGQLLFNSKTPSHLPVKHQFRINKNIRPDEKLNNLSQPALPNEDPRGNDPTKRLTKKARKNGNGRNTESFDPADTLVRPDLRVWVGSKDKKVYDKPLKHDDVVIVPELFGPEDDWNLYYQLVDEIRALQNSGNKKANWESWHEGAHLLCKTPTGSPTFNKIIDRLCEYFKIQKKSAGTRFNWYRDSSDWKPFHHDSAAYNAHRARTQNITVGVSFGARRELAFLRATPQENGDKVKLYFPQTNNGVFSFGRDVNILWKHGINALAEEEQDGKGRISIILWGLAEDVKEEAGSPPLLGSDGQGVHANNNSGNRHGNNRNGGRNDRRRNNRHGGPRRNENNGRNGQK